MCELSIIVPVYNSRLYLERTVNALLTQNSEFEILLIDDGSIDGSNILCDELASRTETIRCFHIENGGPGRARNFGIRHANGKYIAFCDADDIPGDNMYGILLETLKEQAVDLVMCDIFTERDDKAFGFPWPGNVRFDGNDIESEIIASMLGNLTDDDPTQPIWGSSVRCIYRKDIIEKYQIEFPEDIRFAEDLVFNLKYLMHIKSCYILNQVLYRYTFNKSSLMNSHNRYNPTMFDEHRKLVDYVCQILATSNYQGELNHRFQTSQRCYFVESVGNAARSIKKYGVRHAYREISRIVHDRQVCSAFSDYDAKAWKKRTSYSLIRHKLAFLLLCYYYIRLRH